MPIGANVDAHRAEYQYLDLKSLMSYAYGVKPYQITGPDWMATEHFDIVAKLPEGSKKEDAPKMLQTLRMPEACPSLLFLSLVRPTAKVIPKSVGVPGQMTATSIITR